MHFAGGEVQHAARSICTTQACTSRNNVQYVTNSLPLAAMELACTRALAGVWMCVFVCARPRSPGADRTLPHRSGADTCAAPRGLVECEISRQSVAAFDRICRACQRRGRADGVCACACVGARVVASVRPHGSTTGHAVSARPTDIPPGIVARPHVRTCARSGVETCGVPGGGSTAARPSSRPASAAARAAGSARRACRGARGGRRRRGCAA